MSKRTNLQINMAAKAAQVGRKPPVDRTMAPAVRDRRILPKAKVVPMAKKAKIVVALPAGVVAP